MLQLPAAALQFLRSEAGGLFREDVLAWAKWHSHADWYRGRLSHLPETSDLEFHAARLFETLGEFRSLFDYRTKSIHGVPGFMKHSLLRARDLHIWCNSIGPRFMIQHGQVTFILAREIGSDFFVNHGVTIGTNHGIPSIGNRVIVRTGAVVVGSITVGNDVIITANAVVSFDVPDNHVARAPRTELVPRNRR